MLIYGRKLLGKKKDLINKIQSNSCKKVFKIIFKGESIPYDSLR